MPWLANGKGVSPMNPIEAVKKARVQTDKAMHDVDVSDDVDVDQIRRDMCEHLPPCPFCGKPAVPSAWGWMELGVTCSSAKERCSFASIWMPAHQWILSWVKRRDEMQLLSDAFGSMGRIMAFDPRDWSVNFRDAWLYAIVCGWDSEEESEEDAMGEVAADHMWSSTDITRLRSMRAGVKALTDSVEPRSLRKQALQADE